jgi:hypothetical protein
MKQILAKLFGMGGDKLLESANKLLGTIDKMNMGSGEKAELRARVVDRLIDSQLAAQANVKSEIASKHWLAANWRPMLAVQWGFIVTYTYFLAPMFDLPTVALDPKVYNLLVICLTGYGSLRSVEKVAGKVVPYFTAKQLRKLQKNGIGEE